MADWLTIEELAAQEGITIDGARKRAQRGQYEKKKDGRRTLYRVFTPEAAEQVGKKETSAQSAYLLAKAKKMQADAEAAELKLVREKMLLYDSIRTDVLAVIRYTAERLKSEMDFLTEDQQRKFYAVTAAITQDAVKRFYDFREERAKKATPYEVELEKGYHEYDQKKTKEERAAAEAAKREEAKRREERRASMTRDEIEFEALRKFRDAGYRLLTAKPREAKEAQEWQAAEMELEKDWTFSMRDAKTREEIEEVTLEFIGRLEERAQEILSR